MKRGCGTGAGKALEMPPASGTPPAPQNRLHLRTEQRQHVRPLCLKINAPNQQTVISPLLKSKQKASGSQNLHPRGAMGETAQVLQLC